MYSSRSENKLYGVTNNESLISTRTHMVNKLLCFVIHGFSTKFAIPVAYFFSRGTSGKRLCEMTMCILHEVRNCGFNIILVRLIADNHKSNIVLFRHFGKKQAFLIRLLMDCNFLCPLITVMRLKMPGIWRN